MDAKVTLRYGEESRTVDIQSAADIQTILPLPMDEITDLKAAFLHAVTDGVIGSAPLREIIAPDDSVTIVVSER